MTGDVLLPLIVCCALSAIVGLTFVLSEAGRQTVQIVFAAVTAGLGLLVLATAGLNADLPGMGAGVLIMLGGLFWILCLAP